jgi:Protein of unknown function (DUF982)
MCSDRSFHFPAIWLLVGVGEQYKPVDTVVGAAEILLHEWPPTTGKAYLNALQACLDSLQENGPVDAVPEALMRAADEAFICYIHVIGGGKQHHWQQTPRSRAEHVIPERPLVHSRKTADAWFSFLYTAPSWG